ncbi:MAG: hypothetical protein JWN40_5823 [Phycisphaerales bacterium]|nr:hypothetical protein [Phycisphaerales bacterium]
MRRDPRTSTWFALAASAVGISVTGCASQPHFSAVDAEIKPARYDMQTWPVQSAAYRDPLTINASESWGKYGLNPKSLSKTFHFAGHPADVEQSYVQAMEGAASPLPQAQSSELSEFAAENGDLLEYKSSYGMIQFKSDLTFVPRSSELTPRMQDAVSRLARILNHKNCREFELMIVGHTDNVEVNAAQIFLQCPKDNWYLSAHRAIAVGLALNKSGVRLNRMTMAGYADERPLGNNATESGRSKNRRVELLIVRAPSGDVMAEWAAAGKAGDVEDDQASDRVAHHRAISALAEVGAERNSP